MDPHSSPPPPSFLEDNPSEPHCGQYKCAYPQGRAEKLKKDAANLSSSNGKPTTSGAVLGDRERFLPAKGDLSCSALRALGQQEDFARVLIAGGEGARLPLTS